MNVLREVRRASNKSMPVRIMLLLAFCVIFVVTTYAWFSVQRSVDFEGLKGSTTPWYVAYYVNADEEEHFEQLATLTIDELYPGMPDHEDIVHVYNVGTASTQIKYELISVKIFGVEVLEDLKNDQEISQTGNTTSVFSKDTNYPFNVSYTYDKTYLKGTYVDDVTTPDAMATFEFNVDWPYRKGDTQEELTARDILDTKFGKDAYKYYQDGNGSNTAIEIKVRITSEMIHPSQETENN